jgi:nitroimidazol reductase NimA-like FMN-containing flavoprotein (pyridoxamine 5'-phosphate oxidase superfamily)
MTASRELTELVVLTPVECASHLAKACVGRIGFMHAGQPEILPVNFASDREGTVVFRAAAHSILSEVVGQPVVFEVDGLDESRRCGWSVCVHGVGHELTEDHHPMAEQLRKLDVISWAPGQRDRWFVVIPTSLTGRRIPVSIASEEGWFPGIPAG